MLSARRVLFCCTAAAAAVLSAASAAKAVGDVVISQVWGGSVSGTGSATLPRSDYVELFNRSTNPVSMAGWGVYIASSGTSNTYSIVPLSGTIGPGEYRLVQLFATPTTNGTDLPTPDFTAAANITTLTTTTGKVALRTVTTALTTCPPFDATLIDLVTYGTTTTTCREGAGNAPGGSTTTLVTPTRNGSGCVDSDNNNLDFAAVVLSPRNSATPAIVCGALGACCDNNTGVCSISAGSGSCTGTYQGDGSSCSPNPCPPTGACCNGTTGGTCTILTATGCSGAINGFYQGNGTVCSPTPCSTASCCFPDRSCCNLLPALCTQQGGTPGTGTCTAVGNCIPAPSNDACANPIVLSLSTPFAGNNFAATSTDGLNDFCVTTSSKGVWFSFTPSATSTFDITTCGTIFDSVVTVFTIGNCADTATWSVIGCDDDECPTGSSSFCGSTSSAAAASLSGVQLSAGQTYYIRVSLFGTSATGGGNYTVQINDTGIQPVGACCMTVSGVCEIRTSLGCFGSGTTALGTYQGDGSTCSPSPCAASGACCSGNFCIIRPPASCTGTSIYQGDGTVCGPNPCITGACCNNTTGACSVGISTSCSSTTSTYQGDDTTCSPNPCPPSGSCCNLCTTACSVTVQSACAETWTAGATCTPNVCVSGPAPANDEPAGAVALTLGNSVTSTINNATVTTGVGLGCDTSVSKDVWYSFTPATTQFYSVSTCGATFDTVVSVFDSANLATTIACDTDTCVGGTTGEPVVCGTSTSSTLAAIIPFVQLTAGTTYLIRVESGTTSTTIPGGTFPILVNTASAGACCANSTGACTITLATDCSSTTSVYQGDNTACTPSPCPATGACCNNTSGACTTVTSLGCNSSTSTYQGDNTVCSPSPCPPSGSCCNTCTSACTTTVETACASPSVWTSGAVCSPNPCLGSAPANDLACGAIALTLNTAVSQNLAGATSTSDGPTASCQTNGNKGVWYSFTPASTGDYTVSTCGATFDSIVAVYTGDCNSPDFFGEIACDDDTCVGGATDPVVCGTGSSSTVAALIPVVNLTAGNTYYIRVQVFSTGVGGTFPLIVKPAASGACCASTGTCTITIAETCASGSVFIAGQTCDVNPCPPTGACCDFCGTCVISFQTACTGTYQGNGSVCDPIPCSGGGAPPNDDCINAIVMNTFPFFDTQCTENATADGPPGSCDSFGQITVMLFSAWYRFTPTVPGELTVNVDFVTWQGNRFSTMHATPDTNCPTTTATEIECGGTDPTNYVINVVPGTTYWVCIGDEGTITTDEGGTYTINASFVPSVSNIACCRGATCSLTTSANCTDPAGTAGAFASTATACNVGSTTTPCCYADYNKVGGISVQDIFDFLNDWFAGSNFADTGGDGTTAPDIQAIFDFLNAWFAGGC